MREKPDLLRRINLICPVQSHLQKHFLSSLTQIKIISAPSRPAWGAYRDRHGRWARDAVDAKAALTNGADADGEVVWFW